MSCVIKRLQYNQIKVSPEKKLFNHRLCWEGGYGLFRALRRGSPEEVPAW
jgi:hypothetical protein